MPPAGERHVVTGSLHGPGISRCGLIPQLYETVGLQAGINPPHVKQGQSHGEDYETMDVRC